MIRIVAATSIITFSALTNGNSDHLLLIISIT